MAISQQQRTELLTLLVGMFDAAPGSDIFDELANGIDNGNTIAQYAANLVESSEFTGIYSRGLTAEEFATSFIANLLGGNVSAEATAEAEAFVAGRLNAGASRDVVIIEALTALSAVSEDDATWGAAVAQLNNKVEVAQYFALNGDFSGLSLDQMQAVLNGVTSDDATVTAATTAIDSGSLEGVGSTGQTFTLTTAVDAVPGSAGNDVINAVVSATAGESTMTLADTIDGAAGTDTFNLTAAGNVAMAASEIKNVEVFNIKNLTGAATAHDFANVTGEEQVWNSGSSVDVAVTGLDAAAIGVANTTTNMTATFKDGTFVADSNVAIALNNAGSKTTDSTITLGQASAAGAATSVSIAATGSNFVTLAAGASAVSAGAGIKTLTVTGEGSVDVDTTSALNATTLKADLTKVDASANNGGVTIELANKDVAVTGGAGDDTITLANGTALSDEASIDLGAGDDTLLDDGSVGVGTDAVIDGGEGTDTISSTLLEVGNQANIVGWEVMDVAGEDRTIDASLFKSSTFESLAKSAATSDDVTITKLEGNTIVLNDTSASNDSNVLTAFLADATGSSDSAEINFNGDGNTTLAEFVTAGLETITIDSSAEGSGDANEVTALTNNDNVLTTVTITGANDFTLGEVSTNASATSATANVASSLTLIDGSAATGDLDITAGGSVTIGSTSFKTTYSGLTVKTGEGDDNVTAEGAISVETGAGEDYVTVGAAGVSVDVGAADEAVDTVDVLDEAAFTTTAGAFTSSSKVTTISSLETADEIDVSEFSTASAITDFTTTALTYGSLEAAVDAAIAGTADITFFNWVDDNTYIVLDNAVLAGSNGVIELVGTYDDFSVASGVITIG